jgi:putative membrane-bound dehydrogenase-like protein
MTLPPGFHVHLVTSEPTLIKPIAITTDARGRLWVVESHSYPHWLPEGKTGKDRILILEPDDRGGWRCKVFWDKGTNLSGIALGFGGVYLCAVPNILFLPIQPGEDKPAGEPRVLLDGWSMKAQHNVFNCLTWGPDGWLYGCNGILSNSRVGKPGTPYDKRVAIDCGVWRYHPTRRVFEAFAHGTTNPWGLDFDDRGEMFITNCVIKHIFHVIPGAHFVRMFGQDLNPYCYGLMESCADHIHWAGGNWTTSRGGKGAHDAAGGGHAHAGALVYLGGAWPKEYRGRVLMCNIHGNRLNQNLIERSGSGYVAKRAPDFLHAHDEWFRGLCLTAAADGGVFVADWHDTGECHNYDKTHPSGRIYKVDFGTPSIVHPDMDSASDDDLLRAQDSTNDWWVRKARQALQERAQAGKVASHVKSQLWQMVEKRKHHPRKLRALWALYSIGGADEKKLLSLLDCEHETVRSWAVRMLVDAGVPSKEAVAKLTAHAGKEKSSWVRLALASALQRLAPVGPWALAEALVAHGEDAEDANLPLMLWFGIEPLVPDDPTKATELLVKAKIPLVRRHIARRIAALADAKEPFSPKQREETQTRRVSEGAQTRRVSEGTGQRFTRLRVGISAIRAEEAPQPLDVLVRVLSSSDDVAIQRDILEGMSDALAGRRNVPAPAGWSEVHRKLRASKDAEVRERTLTLSVLFGDPQALAELKRTVEEDKAGAEVRARALQTLLDKRAEGVPALLRKLLDDPDLRRPALRGLAAYDDPSAPALILGRYAKLTDKEKADAIGTLASRPAFGLALLDAMEKKQVPTADLSPFLARQMAAFNDRQVTARLSSVWGTVRPTAKDRSALLAKYAKLATSEQMKIASRSNGRAVFAKTCAQCHVLFGEGARIGPELTGSQRAKPEYILTKVLDPNAVVAKDYQVTRIVLASGRILQGLVKEETDKLLQLQTPTELVRILKSDIETREKQDQSMMPEGQLAPLNDTEVRDLLAYLAGDGQVPLPKKP